MISNPKNILYISHDVREFELVQKYFNQKQLPYKLSYANLNTYTKFLENNFFNFVIASFDNQMDLLEQFSKKFGKYPVIFLSNEKKEIIENIAPNFYRVIKKAQNFIEVLEKVIKIDEKYFLNGVFYEITKILNLFDDITMIIDNNTNILYLNKIAESRLNLDIEKYLNNQLDKVLNIKFFEKNLYLQKLIQDTNWKGEVLIEFANQESIYAELKIKKFNQLNILTFTDISATKEIQKQLHILSDIVLNTSDGIVLTNLEQKIIFVNKSKAEMLGYTTEELIGKHVSIFSGTNTELKDRMENIHKQLLKKIIWQGEFTEVKKDGKEITIFLSSKLLRTDDGKPYGILSTSQDITDKKELENKLKESEEWHRTLLANISGIVIFFEPHGKIEYVNSVTEAILEYSIEELYKINFFDLFKFEDSRQEYNILDDILNGKFLQGINSSVKTRSGKIKHIVCNISPKYDSYGFINGIILNGIDITELKLVEQKLAETYNYFENLIKNSADGIATFDLEARVVTWNNACEKIYGYTSEEVLGKKILFTIPPQHLAEWEKIYRGVLQGETYNNIEVERTHKDGRIIYLVLTVSPIKNLEGKIIGISSFIRDVTSKKLLEKQAQILETKYKQLFEESKDFIFETTADGKFISINQAGLEILGYSSKEEILSLDISRDLYVNPDEREKFKYEIQKKGYVIDYEIQLKKKNGERISLIETATAVYDDNNNIIGYRGIGRDLTEKKRHQERIISLLIASQAFSRNTTENEIIDTISKAIKRLDYNLIILMRHGNSLKIVRTTFDESMVKGLERMYNFRLSNFMIPYKKHTGFKSVIENKKTVLCEKSKEKLIEILPAHIPRHELEIFIQEIGYKNRSISIPLVVFNEVIGILIINSDDFKQEDIPIFNLYAAQLNAALENARLYQRLTQANEELRNAYEKLHESQTMLIHSEKMKAIGDLASGVAHDFNNLLGIIAGRAQLLQLQATDQKIKNGLDVILKAAMDGADTVKRLQDFAKKKVEDNASAIDVNMIIEDVIQLTQTKWKDISQQKGIKIDIVRVFDKLPIVYGSGSELREILTNLILNSVDAMPNGGTITIKTKNLDRLYCIEIEDTGVGIPADILPKIFNPFYTTKGERGTGLGLSMVKALVSKRQGEISVQSEVGVGTKFTITFPKLNIDKGQNLQNDTSQTFNSQLTSDYSILIIDDEEEIRLLLAEILQQTGYNVSVAKDGPEGLEKFRNSNIDIVFTDLGMPEMNGWKVAKEIKKIKPNTPVILISGWGRDLKNQDITNTGVDFLAEKPFHIDEILQILSKAKNLIKK